MAKQNAQCRIRATGWHAVASSEPTMDFTKSEHTLRMNQHEFRASTQLVRHAPWSIFLS